MNMAEPRGPYRQNPCAILPLRISSLVGTELQRLNALPSGPTGNTWQSLRMEPVVPGLR